MITMGRAIADKREGDFCYVSLFLFTFSARCCYVNRPPAGCRRLQIFGFFGVFGPFSGFFVVGDGPGASGNPFSCPEIDFSS